MRDNRETHGMRLITILLSFLVEVAMLTAFCLGGLRLGITSWIQLVAGFGIAVVVTLFRGALRAPWSMRPILWPWRLLIILARKWRS